MKIEFKIFHESAKPPNAERAIRKMIKINKSDFDIVKVDRYLDKGCLAVCETTVEAESWEEFIYKVLLFGQSFGSWSIGGSIDEELRLWSTSFQGGDGVTAAGITVSRESFNA
jgi:hypothetical protein